MAETRVLVQAADALVGAGLSSHLATHPDIVVATAEIAEEMRSSVSTVKSVIYGVMDRYKLRNRSHAVAYAVRPG